MRWFVAIAVMAGCNGGEPVDEGPIDVRVDAAPQGDTSDASGVRMCAVEDDVTVVWIDEREGFQAVFANHSADRGVTWDREATRLSEGEVGVFAPVIACSDRAVVVAWEDARDGELENHNIYVARSDDGGARWDDEIAIDEDPGGDVMSLGTSIAMDGSHVYVAWYQSVSGAYDIYVAASHDAAESFGEPVRVDGDEPGAAYSAWPHVATNGGDNVWVVWEDTRAGGSDIWFSRSTNGGASFAPDQRLDTGEDAGESDSFSPRIAADGDDLWVVWHDERFGEGRDVLLQVSDDGGESFATEPMRVDSDQEGFFDSLYPQVIALDGAAHVVWQDARDVGFDIYHRKVDGDDFAGPEQRLDTDRAGTANSTFPVITTDGASIAVAWLDYRNDGEGVGYDDIYYNHSTDGGTTWAVEDLRLDRVASGSKFATDLNLGVSRGDLLAAWADGRNGDVDVFFHVMPVGESSPPVSAE